MEHLPGKRGWVSLLRPEADRPVQRKQLQVAWAYDSGTERPYEFNPIVVGKTMYVLAKNTAIVALDASTGKELWTYHSRNLGQRIETHRGINYWQSSDGSDKRLLISFADNLEAINAANGQLITSFGKDGTVNLKEGLGQDPELDAPDPVRNPRRRL